MGELNEVDELGNWEPLPLSELAELLGPASFPWWVAGGYAVDLFLGGATRAHHDLDVEFLRRDQLPVREALAGWDLRVAIDGRLSPWKTGAWLDREHFVWARPGAERPWAIELILSDTADDAWVFRRNPEIRIPLSRFGRTNADGLPYLDPEVVLLFKAKAPRPPDVADFERVLPVLDDSQRLWLAGALRSTDPGHPWLEQLD